MSLVIEKLSVVYRDGGHALQALEEVSLSLVPGKCSALVGESGSGKTTLGLACLGLLPANASVRGNIAYKGQVLDPTDGSALDAVRWKKIAMVFQNGAANLNPVHRVLDQVAEPLIQHLLWSRKQAGEKAAETLVKLGLDTACHSRYPHQLSGGQSQRVLLAMAMILDPDVLILDEPTSALDAMNKGIVGRVMGEAKQAGKAVLLITHDLEFAAKNSDTMAVLYLGQIMETLPAADLLVQPLHPYTLALGRSYPTMTTARDLGGIRGDAFYRMVHQHVRSNGQTYQHTHIQVPGSSHKNGHAPPAGCLFQNRCTQAIDRCCHEDVPLEKVGNHEVRCLRHGIVDLLQLRGVSKRYNETVALQSTDLTLKHGEAFCLVGETGSGKTTLAIITAGALQPDRGSRHFDGMDTGQTDHRSLARRIGVIYQNPAESVSHRFSVLNIVAEPLKIHESALSRDQIKDRVKRVLAEVHLSTDDAFLSRYPHELNMGAIQRVCMARALILDPSLLVADEPTSSLDPSVQAKVMKRLLDLQTERGLTLLFVTHDIGLARKIGDRLGVMLGGDLIEVGPAPQILAGPRHPYTQLLLGSAGGSLDAAFPVATGLGPEASPGCSFVSRCPRAQDVCWRENPPLLEKNHRSVACHFPLEVKGSAFDGLPPKC
jgi:peptide/nickel transport system ATP-binding protein